jgi:hypothetical protein
MANSAPKGQPTTPAPKRQMRPSTAQKHLVNANVEYVEAKEALDGSPEAEDRYQTAKRNLWKARQKWRKVRVHPGTVARPKTIEAGTEYPS